ncbi:MAG: hypothetical protein ACYC2P_06980 [Paludibacteraceae bacterium]
MKNSGEYIYIILLLLFALSGLFRGKNKSKESKKSIFDTIPKSWEELDDMVEKQKEQTASSKTPVSPNPAYESVTRPVATTLKPTASYSSTETITSPEYNVNGLEIISYDTATDFNKLRIKQQIKERVSKSHASLGSFNQDDGDEENTSLFEISLDSAEDAKRAFIYSEIFNRKY